MKKYLLLGISFLMMSTVANAQIKVAERKSPNKGVMEPSSIHAFVVKDIHGNDFSFKNLEGRKLIIVNTASLCGNTPQYADLQKLHQDYGAKVTVIGFPSNDFGEQEPGANKDIAAFCRKMYGVTFPMMEKISVTGETMHPIYKFLTGDKKRGGGEVSVRWNFQKFLIDEKGQVVRVLAPDERIDSPAVIDWIKG